MSRLVEHKSALSVAITVIERNPGHASVVVVPGFSIGSVEDGPGTSVNALDFFPGHSDLRRSRRWRRNKGSLIFSHRSGCASRAQEPTSESQQKNPFHRSHYKPRCDDCIWKRACVENARVPLILNFKLRMPKTEELGWCAGGTCREGHL